MEARDKRTEGKEEEGKTGPRILQMGAKKGRRRNRERKRERKRHDALYI